MGYGLGWLLFGGLIGLHAADKKGWHPAMGFLGGAMLGILAPLLYFASGLVSRGGQRMKCPFCDEWVSQKALICKHCQSHLSGVAQKPQERPPSKALARLAAVPLIGWLGGALLLAVAALLVFG